MVFHILKQHACYIERVNVDEPVRGVGHDVINILNSVQFNVNLIVA